MNNNYIRLYLATRIPRNEIFRLKLFLVCLYCLDFTMHMMYVCRYVCGNFLYHLVNMRRVSFNSLSSAGKLFLKSLHELLSTICGPLIHLGQAYEHKLNGNFFISIYAFFTAITLCKFNLFVTLENVET